MSPLPRALQRLISESEGLPRALYLPELRAACSILKTGMVEPYPGVYVSSRDVEESRNIYRTVWTIELERVRVTLTSKLWSPNLHRRAPGPTPKNIERTRAERTA